MSKAFAPFEKLVGLDDLPPIWKQLPFLVLFAAAVIMSSFIPTLTVSDWPVVIGGAVLTLVGAGLTLVFTKPEVVHFSAIVPALDFFAAGALRHGTGEVHSVYASIVLIPVLWFASLDGRRHVGYAAAGATIAIMVPFALGTTIEENPNELSRGIFSTIIFALAAAVVNELARRARRRLRIARKQAAAATEELSAAAQIQRFLLPRNAAPLPGYQTAGVCIPSKAVGGDFFDWYLIDDGIAFTLGDVMGKGAGAGMIAATARAVVRSARNSDDPVTALALTSDFLATDLSQAGSFATLFHARLRSADGRVLFSDAGHGLTLLVRADGTWERLASRDMPVGLMPDATWQSAEIQLGQGDMMVCFSDGVLDLYDGTLSAIDEIGRLAVKARSAQDIVDAVSDLALESGNPDDVTVLAVRRDRRNPNRTGNAPEGRERRSERIQVAAQ